MADYFVASGGSNTAPYDTWAKAATSLQTALTAASSGSDRVIIQYNGVPAGDAEVAADTTYTAAADVTIIASTNSGTSTVTPTAMGDANWIGSSGATSYAVSISGAFAVTAFGLTLRVEGTTNKNILLHATQDGGVRLLTDCLLWLGTTQSSSFVALVPTTATGGHNSYTKLVGCVFRFDATTTGIAVGGGCKIELYGCSLHASSAAASPLFEPIQGSGNIWSEGCDWSSAGTSIVASSNGNGVREFTFVNCKLPASFAMLATQTPSDLSANHVLAYDCDSGDVHYAFGHYNALGSCVAYTSIYANDGPTYDGATEFSWRIDTSGSATFNEPYVSPWISTYHSGTSAITPRLEILRDDSATAFDDDEVWGEFSYQGTTGYPLSTIVNDRMALAGTPAAQSSGMGTGSWTGEGGTAWSGKINPGSTITPAEIGELKARVCVGLASATVYVDPQIRTS